LLGGDLLEASRWSVADVDGPAGASAGSRSASYQLQQYETSSRRNDPYVAGYGDHRDAPVSLAELDAALSLLQKGATASRL
jgi:hypothetical protein